MNAEGREMAANNPFFRHGQIVRSKKMNERYAIRNERTSARTSDARNPNLLAHQPSRSLESRISDVWSLSVKGSLGLESIYPESNYYMII